MKKETFHVYGLEEMQEFARSFSERYVGEKQGDAAKIFALSGELGAGKTTFVRALAEVLGVKQGVVSPTFVIERRYALKHSVFQTLVHIDAYRLHGEHDVSALGLEETLSDPKRVVFIEWSENIKSVLPEQITTLLFQHVDETTRTIEIQAFE